MVSTNAYDFADELRRTELLSRQQLTQIFPQLAQFSEAQELAFALVQRGWLTSYQAEQALAGNAHNLVIGGYSLLEPIGGGGMGLVFKAKQHRLKRTVALKIIRPELVAKNPAAVRRFKREAMAVAQLSHPNIVVIYDADQSDGSNYLIMEYVDGPDLGRLVAEAGPLPLPLACDFVRQAALGLQHAFRIGLVHRDIKPTNLLVARQDAAHKADTKDTAPKPGWQSWWDSVAHGVVKILDLGLARLEESPDTNTSLTREGAMLGTPDYVAPEQARDASSADIRADIYSLGCTFYFLLAGRPPFPTGTMIEKLMMHQMQEPTPIEKLRADIPPSVLAIIRKMMAKTPEHRYQQPGEVADALATVLSMPVLHGLAQVGSPVAVATADQTPSSVPEPESEKPTHVQISAQATPAASSEQDSSHSSLESPSVAVVTAHSLQPVETEEATEEFPLVEGRKIAVLRAHTGPVMTLAFSPDCKMLATGGLDHCVRLWYLAQPPREQAILQEPKLGDLQRLVFSPNGDTIVTGASSFDARMWCWHWKKPLGRDRFPFEGASSYSDSLAFSPDGTTVATAVGETVGMWTITDEAPKKKTILSTEGSDVRTVAIAPDNRRILTGHADGLIQVWKVGWFGSRPLIQLDGHNDCITCLVFAHDGSLLASSAKDHTVRIWDGSGSSEKAKAIIPEIRGLVRQMMFLPDSQFLLTLSDAGQAIVWTWRDGKKVCEWKLDQNIICSMALANDGGMVAAGSSDGTVTVYDLAPE